jgi:hypothetical protein
MPKYVVVPIVEGYGEVQAVPVLIRRWLEFRRYRNVDVHVGGPVRASGRGAITASARPDRGVEHYVRLAWLRRPDVILILLDADDDCPKKIGAELLARARSVLPEGYPVGVVLACREYEAWFLAASKSPIFRRALAARGLGLPLTSTIRKPSPIARSASPT